ncbi:uncharacterized protein HaLaN_22705 [Haematococcus lacustris]|uniref:Uncharacterized protein n=1 Tax=Haematococcus lacustris TaxID=44745 RepID=A0A699ZUE8_HAELA|nr:uncharacterized protein HaLaN_22705 [Haematococcus lacustris]
MAFTWAGYARWVQESPFIEPGSPLALYIYWSDVAFTIVFGLEVLVKSFAFTFNLYIREITNIRAAQHLRHGQRVPGVPHVLHHLRHPWHAAVHGPDVEVGHHSQPAKPAIKADLHAGIAT